MSCLSAWWEAAGRGAVGCRPAKRFKQGGSSCEAVRVVGFALHRKSHSSTGSLPVGLE